MYSCPSVELKLSTGFRFMIKGIEKELLSSWLGKMTFPLAPISRCIVHLGLESLPPPQTNYFWSRGCAKEEGTQHKQSVCTWLLFWGSWWLSLFPLVRVWLHNLICKSEENWSTGNGKGEKESIGQGEKCHCFRLSNSKNRNGTTE